MNAELLEVRDLRVFYWSDRGPIRAVDGVTFDIMRGERFGIVGESGCGKSTMAMALLRLLRSPGRIEGGQVLLGGIDLATLGEREMRRQRWRAISLIPQGAMNALNPTMTIYNQTADAIWAHGDYIHGGSSLRSRVDALLGTVGLSTGVASMYPHELSGGMKQRVCIAMAIALQPELIVADEPTSALDVIVQRVVAQTLVRVVEELGASLLLIGHDMGLQAQLVGRLAVMYAGKIVEVGSVKEVFTEALHPYTRLLIASLPSLRERHVLRGIPGLPPSLLAAPANCRFHPRCPTTMKVCQQEEPALREVSPGRWVACHLY